MPSSPDDPDQLGQDQFDLAQRLKEAKRRNEKAPQGNAQGTSGGLDDSMGVGMRSGVEFVAALLVSVGIGLAIDHWLHSAPVALLIMLVLGFGAGLLNVYRAMNGMSYGATYKSPPAKPVTEDEADKV